MPLQENCDSSSENDEISFDSRRLEEEERRYENSSVTSSLDQLARSSKRKSSDANRDVSFRAGTNDRRSRQDRRSIGYTYLYIQMELCRQENLGNWLKNRQPSELKVYQMYRAILSAVNYLHSQVSKKKFTFLLKYFYTKYLPLIFCRGWSIAI